MTKRVKSALRRFLESEATGGLVLMGAAAAALVAANSALAPAYQAALHAELGPMSVQHWVNDALMALFFLLVGLEIKREFLGGALSTWDKRRLPIVAAAAGMAVPALVYLAVAGGDPVLAKGWAIPAATDIAFALGVLALLGSRAPSALKLFLTTIAIADDLGAVAIIALAYTGALDTLALGVAAGVFLTLYLLGKSGVTRLWIYALGAVILWLAVMRSGVHPTVAGVLAAVAIPIGADEARSPLHRIEHALAPWVGWLILPLFGLANAGVALGGLPPDAWAAPLPLGVALGLFVGKQAGIFGAVWLCAKRGWARPPEGASWAQLYGVALLCGVGFTMSLFIGALAFPGRPLLAEEAKIGILIGSLVSALAGYLVLRFTAVPASD